MAKYTYKTQGTCSSQILIETKNGKLNEISFIGGCNGNLQGISQLARGMEIDDVITKLKGIHCGTKTTSCPDQLATALITIKEQENEI